MGYLQEWAMKHRRDTVMYLQSGVLLGMYRDGGFIKDDNDIDIRFAFRNNDFGDLGMEEFELILSLDEKLAFNNLYMWGDIVNGFYTVNVGQFKVGGVNMSNKVMEHLSKELCMPPRSSPFMTHKYTRAEMEFEYGPFWFVKLSFKGMFVQKFQEWATPSSDHFHKYWTGLVRQIHAMDVNNNNVVSPHEVDQKVSKDGIDLVEYSKQISSRDKCRAAAMLTWLLVYSKNPYPLNEIGDQPNHSLGNHTLFLFPACDLLHS